MIDANNYHEIICDQLEDGRIHYWCSTPVDWKEDGWGTCFYRTTVPVPAGTSFDVAAAQSEAFRLTDADLGHRRDGKHIDFSFRGKRTWAHNVHRFTDGSEAVGVVHHPREAMDHRQLRDGVD